MRIALTTALLLLATMALADEPSAPETKTETKTETEATATQAPTETPAAQPAQTQTTAKAETSEKQIAFKPLPGYRPKRIDGAQVWCQKTVVLGSKFPKEDCRTEAEMRELIRSRQSMREDLGQRRPCSGDGCSMN
jgi:hypothetical protein